VGDIGEDEGEGARVGDVCREEVLAFFLGVWGRREEVIRIS
jgi:hypothetical protein